MIESAVASARVSSPLRGLVRSSKAVISGGRPITGWKPGPEGVWVAELPEVTAIKEASGSLAQMAEDVGFPEGVLGPELKVMDFFQGGGRGTEVMLLGLAEKELQRREYAMANDIGSEAVLPMGSLFEGAMFLVFEAVVLRLREVLGETAESMRARHTNME